MRKNILIIGSNHRDAQQMGRCLSAMCRELNTADFVVLNEADETQYLQDSSFDLIVAGWNSARTANYLNGLLPARPPTIICSSDVTADELFKACGDGIELIPPPAPGREFTDPLGAALGKFGFPA